MADSATKPELTRKLPMMPIPEGAGAVDYVENPDDAANHAVAMDAQQSHLVRDERIRGLIDKLPASKVTQQLADTMRRSFSAGETMAVVGYNNLRHLVASGYTLPEIAKNLDVNVLDLAYFMSRHDPEGDHMELDNTLCADSQSQQLFEKLETISEPTKEDIALQQLKLQLIEKRNARLSEKWAGIDMKGNTLIDAQAARIVIMMGQAPQMSDYQNNPRVINSSSNSKKKDDTLQLTEDGKLQF